MDRTQEREPMIDYQEYNEILDAIHQLKELAHMARRKHDYKREVMYRDRIDAICNRCDRIFNDRDENLKNYLNRQPMKMCCEDKPDGVQITPCSGRDTLFVLLICCGRANDEIPLDRETAKYLLKLLKRDGCRIVITAEKE